MKPSSSSFIISVRNIEDPINSQNGTSQDHKATINSPAAHPQVLEQLEQDHKEELHLFRDFGKIFKDRWDQFKRFSTMSFRSLRPSITSIESPENGHSELLKNLASFRPSIKHYEAIELSKALSAAFIVPLYVMKRDEENRQGIPVISSLIRCKIISSDDLTTSFTTATTYCIELQYNNIKWTIHRRTIDFVKLHYMLTFNHIQHRLPKLPHFPNQVIYFLELAWKTSMNVGGRNAERREQHSNARKQSLENYLNQVFFSLHMQVSTELCEFIELSGLSFHSHVQCKKRKEGYLNNRIFAIQPPKSWWRRILSCLWPFTRKKFETKWFIIGISYIAYIDSIDQKTPSDVILCDPFFQLIVDNQSKASQIIHSSPTLTIINSGKQIQVKSASDSQLRYWIESIQELCRQSIFCRINRYQSFCPIRKNIHVEWLVDGREYFDTVCAIMEKAKEEIYMMGWWISPELYLKRPASIYPEWRLDKILERHAKRGIKIYIIIFKELLMTTPVDSAYTKAALERIHPNILVQRHPDHISRGVIYWSQHDKLITIDQKVALIGGLDLCFGRYDDHSHRLVDCSYNNNDMSSNGFQVPYKNDLLSSERSKLVLATQQQTVNRIVSMHKLEHGEEKEIEDILESFTWPGLDYSNPRIRDFRNPREFEISLVDRNIVPRMPWHDVQCMIQGHAALDLSRHFIQKWNFIKSEKSMHRSEVPFLIPCDSRYEEENEDLSMFSDEYKDAHYPCSVQGIRSGSSWSIGALIPEISVMTAYIEMISESKHFIYIENQYLISKCTDDPSIITKNMVFKAILDRIILAYQKKEKFRVIAITPLLPAFESEIYFTQAVTLRMILHAQLTSIQRGPSSLFEQLKQKCPDINPEDYISFFSLRTMEKLKDNYVTEQIYIHSKLMIVDDCKAIIGSANINDRSMLGDRDCEVNVVIEDDTRISSKMNGVDVLVGPKIQELRIKLLQEHLNMIHKDGASCFIDEIDDIHYVNMKDPVIDDFYHGILRKSAIHNTLLYREIFHCLPDDTVLTWDDYKNFIKLSRSVLQLSEKPLGSLVLYPSKFLEKEDITTSLLNPQVILPLEIYY